jgi:D-arabinose 1-dehydrogenase-like Zn-dependent alcohol dehydrogenase
VWDVSALVKIPDAIASEDASSLMRGEIVVFKPLYESGVRLGDCAGIIGVGGLGHLAIQFASKTGAWRQLFSLARHPRERRR